MQLTPSSLSQLESPIKSDRQQQRAFQIANEFYAEMMQFPGMVKRSRECGHGRASFL
jgi:hypothetical protein